MSGSAAFWRALASLGVALGFGEQRWGGREGSPPPSGCAARRGRSHRTARPVVPGAAIHSERKLSAESPERRVGDRPVAKCLRVTTPGSSCHSAVLVSNLPLQQGEPNGPGVIECLRFAEVFGLAAFVTDSISPDAVVLGASSALASLVGRAADELVELRVGDLLPARTFSLGRFELEEAELRHADGRGVPVFVKAQPLRETSALYVGLVFVRPTTQRSLLALARQLVHEVSNPLTSLVCRLDLVGRQLLLREPDRNDELTTHLATAQDGAERVIALVRQFADSLHRVPDRSVSPPPGTAPPDSRRRSKRT